MAILRPFWSFFANYIDVFHKTEDHFEGHFEVLNMSKSKLDQKYDTLLDKIFFFHTCICMISGKTISKRPL